MSFKTRTHTQTFLNTMEFLGTHSCAHIRRHIPQYSSSQSCCDTATELMVFLLQCPRLPLNIHHWTLHGKLWPLAFTQTPSHSASGAPIKQTTRCCLHSDPLSLHIKTHSPPLPLILLFSHSFSLSPRRPASSFLSFCTSLGVLANILLTILFFICFFVLCDEEDLGGCGSWGGWGGGGERREGE